MCKNSDLDKANEDFKRVKDNPQPDYAKDDPSKMPEPGQKS
ncbi:hypothetical protein [Rouxiella sp. WC2420]|uniref:Uncharacterized protein n=1 Tax=Rouxiella sp. WC2420 TaxID=3234145 RepID=A0AB39VX68_9GAMM